MCVYVKTILRTLAKNRGKLAASVEREPSQVRCFQFFVLLAPPSSTLVAY